MPNEDKAWRDGYEARNRKQRPSLYCEFKKIFVDEDGWEWGVYHIIGVQTIIRDGSFHADHVHSLNGKIQKYFSEHELEILAYCGLVEGPLE